MQDQQYLDPNAKILFFILNFSGVGLMFLFLVVPITVVAIGSNASLFVLFLFLFIALAFFSSIAFLIAHLSYKYYRYELREDGFRKEYGIISKKYVTIPYTRIQNVDIYRGLLSRILGLSDLHIQTAGNASLAGPYGQVYSEGTLPGLSEEVAEQLRNELVQRANENRGQGL